MIQTRLIRNNSGFTLLEVMVAVVVLLVGLLGLLQAVNVATEHNLKNQLRDEAVLIGEEQLNLLRTKSFDNYSNGYSPQTIKGKRWNYTVTRSAIQIPTSNSRELIVTVDWGYRNISSHHQVRSVRTK